LILNVVNFAFIPARGGSIGVPGKNIRLLGGKPLILHTLDFAMQSKHFTQVILSTDSSDIAATATRGDVSPNVFSNLSDDQYLDVGQKLIIHKRPPQHAQTLSPIREVLFEISKRQDLLSGFDVLWMLQPTSPYRYAEELIAIQKLLIKDSEWTSLASFTSIGGMHPDRMYLYDSDPYMTALVPQGSQDNKPRQLLSELFIKDGAYYIFKKSLLQRNILLGDRILPFFRDGLSTINIDTETDFKIAELISGLNCL
jgi:CMP-N-acetylneuraminic acid synthetase